jgi:hypothetical protein
MWQGNDDTTETFQQELKAKSTERYTQEHLKFSSKGALTYLIK